MSIIFIDDVLFNDNGEERKIRYDNCILFLVLNGLSILSGIFYLYFYFIIPNYQNSSNTLSLYLNIFHLISNIFYFFIFFQFYFCKLSYLSFSIKIVTMFNPLIIFCIYYWSVCLTHNLYVTYYNYIHNINKRIKFYKYLLFLISMIFYIFILLNIHYNDNEITSKNFYLISNYKKPLIDIFYICGLLMIIYIIVKLYYVLNKKEDFTSINEYQENQERGEKIKNIFNSIIKMNISFIIYFLVTYTPTNIAMIFKYIFNCENIKTYFIDFITILLICFSGIFIFLLRLYDPLMRTFLINLILFNREFISKYKEHLLKEKQLNESFLSNSFNESFSDNNIKIVRRLKKTKTIKMAPSFAFAFGKNKKAEKEDEVKTETNNNNNNIKINKPSLLYSKTIKNSNQFEMNNLNIHGNIDDISELNELEEFYYKESDENVIDNKNDNDNANNNLNNIKELNDVNSIEVKDINISENQNKKNKSQDKDNNLEKNTFESLEKKNNDINIINQNKISKFREDPTIYEKPLIDIEYKMSKFRRRRSFLKINNLTNNSTNSSSIGISGIQDRRSVSKINDDSIFHEEISSFDLMNYHLEMNDNLTRLIALSIAINECRIYDDIKEYKKYYNSTIPWENKDFYKEKTLFKEYNEKNIPSWIKKKNDNIFNNIHFKISSYCPFVFHHIRLIDNISIDDILSSLDPMNNIKNIKSMKVSGGRGNNCINNTWDKKLIIKTIETTEKKILLEKMIIEYHCLMKESNSLLSRIYGIFEIELEDKGRINVMIQKNMDNLPGHTKLLTFDFKGSTVDRQSISNEDINLNKKDLMNKYKKIVLKDLDLKIVDMKFVIDFNSWQKLISVIDSDSTFLQNYEVTDYSLLVFVHKYRKVDVNNNKNCSRIIPSKDKKYIYSFAIIDYLGTFNLEKKGEKLAKELVGYIKKLKDTNFSVLDPIRYAKRFRNFAKNIIIDG